MGERHTRDQSLAVAEVGRSITTAELISQSLYRSVTVFGERDAAPGIPNFATKNVAGVAGVTFRRVEAEARCYLAVFEAEEKLDSRWDVAVRRETDTFTGDGAEGPHRRGGAPWT